MTEAQLSKGSGAAPEFIRRLVDLGIVPSRDGERPFVLGDIHRVRLAQAFERSGIPLEAIGTAIASRSSVVRLRVLIAMLSARLVSILIVEHA